MSFSPEGSDAPAAGAGTPGPSLSRGTCSLYSDVGPSVWQHVPAAVSLVNTFTNAFFIFHPMRQ